MCCALQSDPGAHKLWTVHERHAVGFGTPEHSNRFRVDQDDVAQIQQDACWCLRSEKRLQRGGMVTVEFPTQREEHAVAARAALDSVGHARYLQEQRVRQR